ncbi:MULTISPECIES: hypothetical protein [Streptomyces]|uniref:hypothetical protein n=1 Tax=Streptomyces TaxID=1883 RepID=UPI00198E3B7B|nr:MULTISPECIES: hypothetical protein [Streptomyces]WTD46236.1 hypothetical protein OG899_01145 [Streptomyces thermoviolaceus]GGV65760.1 hypothetical protein GCM10010499_10320 [Streptomyces thermoviolaceus subsp. apingens]
MPDAVAARSAARAVAVDAPEPPADGPSPGPLADRLSAVADAVLYEGYLLYPYRRSSPKNRVRWQFGVLLPRAWVERDGPVAPGVSGSADSWYQRTECLLRAGRDDAVVTVRVRYLQMQHKQVEQALPGGFRPVDSLHTADGVRHLTFDEAVPRETRLTVALGDLLRRELTAEAGAAAGEETEDLPAGAGRVVRSRLQVHARVTLTAQRLGTDLVRLRVRTENTGRCPDPSVPRDRALRQALIATHTLITGSAVRFVSLIDPPAGLAKAAAGCRNEFTFPVLGGDPDVGPGGDGQAAPAVLSAPILLPDHPQVAPESPGDLHDAAEIDEILTLRTMLLTDEEKAEARATDPRAAEILDRVDTMPAEVLARLHGAIRSLAPAAGETPGTSRDAAPAGPPERPAWWQEDAAGPSPATDTVLVDGVRVGRGSRVRLRPRRGADAQDMFLAGRTAHVAGVFRDVDDGVQVAVTVDDDPAAELHTWYGRFHYFRPDELEPAEPSPSPAPTPDGDAPTRTTTPPTPFPDHGQ